VALPNFFGRPTGLAFAGKRAAAVRAWPRPGFGGDLTPAVFGPALLPTLVADRLTDAGAFFVVAVFFFVAMNLCQRARSLPPVAHLRRPG
jgi:hypothetical protein